MCSKQVKGQIVWHHFWDVCMPSVELSHQSFLLYLILNGNGQKERKEKNSDKIDGQDLSNVQLRCSCLVAQLVKSIVCSLQIYMSKNMIDDLMNWVRLIRMYPDMRENLLNVQLSAVVWLHLADQTYHFLIINLYLIDALVNWDHLIGCFRVEERELAKYITGLHLSDCR